MKGLRMIVEHTELMFSSIPLEIIRKLVQGV